MLVPCSSHIPFGFFLRKIIVFARSLLLSVLGIQNNTRIACFPKEFIAQLNDWFDNASVKYFVQPSLHCFHGLLHIKNRISFN